MGLPTVVDAHDSGIHHVSFIWFNFNSLSSFFVSLYSVVRKHAMGLYNAHGGKNSPLLVTEAFQGNHNVSVPRLVSDQLQGQTPKGCFLALGRDCILARMWGEMQGRHQASICFPEGRAVLSIRNCQEKFTGFAPRPRTSKECCLKEWHNIH